MADLLLSYGITTYISRDILIVSIQADFYVEVLEALRKKILDQLHHSPDIKGLIVDLSNVTLLDVSDMKALEEILRMANVLGGVEAFLVGLNPLVALSLIELGYDPGQLQTALTIEQASLLIQETVHAKKIDVIEETNMTDVDDANIEDFQEIVGVYDSPE